MGAVHAWYYTDPASPWSWAIEPHVRRLTVELEGQLKLTYVMGGIRELGAGRDEAREWLAAAAASGMPVDVRLWLEGAPTTSYPACLAVKAAAEQGDPGDFLRALREGFAFRRRRLDHAEAFGADLDRARAVAPERQSQDQGRVELPSIEFRGQDGQVDAVYGPQPYEAYRDAAAAAGAVFGSRAAVSVEEALRRFGTMATVEVAAVCDLPGPRAAAELWRAAADWRVRAEPTLGGEVWSLA